MNNYSGASLFNLLTIAINRNDRDTQENNNNSNSNNNESDHKYVNIDSSTISIFGGDSLSVLRDIYCFTLTAQYYSSNNTSHRKKNMNSNMNGNINGSGNINEKNNVDINGDHCTYGGMHVSSTTSNNYNNINNRYVTNSGTNSSGINNGKMEILLILHAHVKIQ